LAVLILVAAAAIISALWLLIRSRAGGNDIKALTDVARRMAGSQPEPEGEPAPRSDIGELSEALKRAASRLQA